MLSYGILKKKHHHQRQSNQEIKDVGIDHTSCHRSSLGIEYLKYDVSYVFFAHVLMKTLVDAHDMDDNYLCIHCVNHWREKNARKTLNRWLFRLRRTKEKKDPCENNVLLFRRFLSM